jgi:hypothetical protein
MGGLAGGSVGLGAAAAFAGTLPAGLVLTAVGAAGVGTLLAGVAALAPAVWLRRLPAVPLLGATEEARLVRGPGLLRLDGRLLAAVGSGVGVRGRFAAPRFRAMRG